MPNDGTYIQAEPLRNNFLDAANEGQWSLVVGGIPIVLHEHGGWKVPVNHNYMELRDGDNNVLRRMHSREVDMQGSGEMLTGVYGSQHLPFEADVIGNNDPHETNPNMLRDGDNPDYVGAIVTGTREEILGVYHQTLLGVVGFGNEDFQYNALSIGLNGNNATAELAEITARAAKAQGLEVTEFDPKGLDLGFDASEIDSTIGDKICYDSEEELLSAIDALEKTAAEQHQFTLTVPEADTHIGVPQDSLLTCDSASKLKL